MSSATASDPVRFEFGEAFDALVDEDYAAEREKEQLWTDAEVEAERDAAYRRGVDAGRAETLNGTESRIAELAAKAVASAAELIGALDETEAALREEAMTLALSVGRKVASELLVQLRDRETEALVGEALAMLAQQPHVVIRVNEDLVDGFRARFETIASERGFAGRLVILGDPDIADADCQIDWADGGIRRDGGDLEAKLDEIVARHLKPQRTTQPQHAGAGQPDCTPLPENTPLPEDPAMSAGTNDHEPEHARDRLDEDTT